jgi:hypothetical protein
VIRISELAEVVLWHPVTEILLVLTCQFAAAIHQPRAADCFGRYVAVRVVDIRRVDLGDAAIGILSSRSQ